MKKTIKKSFKDLPHHIVSNLYWFTKKVSDMSTDHIQNAIIYLGKKIENAEKYGVGKMYIDEISYSEWVDIFKIELKKRGVIK